MIERSEADRRPAEVGRSWDRIERRLGEAAAALREGASDERFRWFAHHTGRELPEDVRRTWQTHDGQVCDAQGVPTVPGVFFGVVMLPLLDPNTLSALRIWRDHVRWASGGGAGTGGPWSSSPPGAIRTVAWSEGWIPMGIDPHGHLLAIDLEPGVGGTTVQVIAVAREDPVRYVLAPGWAQFLEDVADELEAGGDLLRRAVSPAASVPSVRFFESPIRWLLERLRPTPRGPASLLDLRREWSAAKLGPAARASAPAPTGAGPYPVLTGPLADECAGAVRGFVAAMADWERYCLALRPLRPFGFSEFSEQAKVDGRVFNTGSSGIEDEAEGRPEEDLVRLMQGDELTQAEKDRVLRVGAFFEEAMRRKQEIYREFWSEMPESERIWYRYGDPPLHDPSRNRIATIRRVSQDHVVVLLESETEAGWPDFRGYHLRPVDGRWRITAAVYPKEEEFCRLIPRPTRAFDHDARVASWHPDAVAIARARELMKVLETDPLLEALEARGGDLFAALEAVGAYSDRDEDGVCTELSLAQTAVTDAGMAPIAVLTGLQALTLSPRITDAGMVHLAGMTGLAELRFGDGLDKPRIEGPGLAHLGAMHRLERLDLGYLPLTDAGMAHMKGPSGLRELLIYHTDLTDAGLAPLAYLPNLEELSAHETQVRGPGLAHLAAPARLRSLDLHETPVDDAGVAHLAGLTGLEDLNLHQTNVTDAGLRHLAGLTGLKDLALPEAGVTEAGRARLLAALPGCRILRG